MNYSAVIVAAGQGRRMNLGYNKVYYRFPDGETVLAKTMKVFEQDPRCKQIIVVTQKEDFIYYMKDVDARGSLVVVEGGDTRQQSVQNGLMAVSEEFVFIHDGARPYVDQASLDRLCDCLETHDACLLTVPCKDTIKRVDQNGQVIETLVRSELIQAQTPQCFKTELILDAYRKASKTGVQVTDDASVVELMSDVPVIAVEGSYSNIKITTPEDIQ